MKSEVLSGLNLSTSIASQIARSNNEVAKLKNNLNNLENDDKSTKEIKSAAKDFEAMLLSQMMNEMWKSVPDNSLFGKSQEEDYFREMLTSEIAKEISMGQGLGIQDLVVTELEKKK